MNIQRISVTPETTGVPAFKQSFVTLSLKNSGEFTARTVVDAFNSKFFPKIKKTQQIEADELIKTAGAGRVISKPKDLINKVNFFALAGGSGSRFKKLAQLFGELFNKINVPMPIIRGRVEKGNYDYHMLDSAMAMGKYFIGEEGVNKIVASTPSGSFGDIVQHYLAGNPIKDTVVCCGDNVFGDSAKEMMPFFIKAINNPDKHVALIGVARTPEEVAERFGVLQVEGSLNDEALKLTGFSEKPILAEAKTLAVDGINIANTGMFYISKEAMEKLIAEIKDGVNNIKKNDTELYDFANAVKYVHSKLPEWFGIQSMEGADVKVVKKWEDVGEPKALYNFLKDVKKGEYLDNFPSETAAEIRRAHDVRVHLDEEIPYINYTDKEVITEEQIMNAPEVDGVKIVV